MHRPMARRPNAWPPTESLEARELVSERSEATRVVKRWTVSVHGRRAVNTLLVASLTWHECERETKRSDPVSIPCEGGDREAGSGRGRDGPDSGAEEDRFAV